MEKEYSPAALLDQLDCSLDGNQDRALFGIRLREIPLVFVWIWFRHAVCFMGTMKYNVLSLLSQRFTRMCL